MSAPVFRIVVLLSGFGSNLQAVIDKVQNGYIPGQICAVLSDKIKAYGLQRAAHVHIPAIDVDINAYPNKESFELALIQQIDLFKPDLVVLSGFMRILSSTFVDHYAERLINIHPSLLPKYPGLATHRKVLLAGDRLHGSTVHYVTDELDSGPLIARISLAVNPDDTVATLTARVQEKEHILYPTVIKWFAQGRLKLQGKTVYLDGLALPEAGAELELI